MLRDILLLVAVAAFFIAGFIVMKKATPYIASYQKAVLKEYDEPLLVETDEEEEEEKEPVKLPENRIKKPAYVIISRGKDVQQVSVRVATGTGKL